MPRIARLKTYESIFHVMCRSISEVDLLGTVEDKLKYIYYIKKYQNIYKFMVYGYCLMDNHVHLIIDANGADISNVMHSINFSYAQYFNKNHNRHGHLFQDRFKSKIIQDDKYLFAASAYIHNNPTDIIKYKDCPEKYEFSSLSVYLGMRQDPYKLVSTRFVLSLFGKKPNAARQRYMRAVSLCNDFKIKEEIEFENEETEYRSERHILARNFKVNDIIEFIVTRMDTPRLKIILKNCKDTVEAKALLVLLMRSLCNYKCSDICKILGNITQARVSQLSSMGVMLLEKNEKFRIMVEEFIKPRTIGAN